MHKKLSFIILLIFFGGCLLHAQDTIQHTTHIKYPALLWEISGNNLAKPSYLYGALETSQKLAYHLTDSFFVAFGKVDKVLLELHPDSVSKALRDPAILKRLYKNSLASSYSPTEKYYNILLPNTFNVDIFEGILSGYSSLYNMYNSGTASDLEEEKTLPDFIYTAALKTGKEISGAVSYLEQLDVSEKAEKLMKEEEKKKKNIREDYAESRILYLRALEAYRKGDLNMLDSLYREMINTPVFFTDIMEPLYQLLAGRIEDHLGDVSLLAIMDATALPGENGIIEHLRRHGYTLRPVSHYILNKPSKKKEKLEKMTRKINLVPYTSVTRFWQVKIPDYTLGAFEEKGAQHLFMDNLNDVQYTVERYPTNAQLASQSPQYLFERMDSILYEYVPGKIIRRKDLMIAGCPGVMVTNRTSRGDLEQFKLIITPLEIIIFKISGPKNYIKKNRTGKKFINASVIHMPDHTEWIQTGSGHGEFQLTLPSYYIVDTLNNLVFVDPEIEYQAWDPQSLSFFLFRRNVHHDLQYLEEDTFDLNFMAETIAKRMKKEIDLSPTSLIQGFPSVRFKLWPKEDPDDTLQGMIILRGASHYLLMTNTHHPSMSEKFFQGFSFHPFTYSLGHDTIADSTLLYTVVSDVLKQESDDKDDEPYYAWMPDDESEKNDGYKRQNKTATYYYDLGSEYITVDMLKEHDYRYYSGYHDLWKALIREATNDSDLIVIALSGDSLATFPYLDLVLTDTNTIRQIHKKFIVNHGVIYTLSSMSDTIEEEKPFTQRFFASFTPFGDTLPGKSLFDDKGMLFIRNFLSRDSVLVKEAIDALEWVSFRDEHRDSLIYLISQKEIMKRNLFTALTLIKAYGDLKKSSYRDDFEKIYDLYRESPAIQTALFKALALQEQPEAMKAILKIMAADLPLPEKKVDLSDVKKSLQKKTELSVMLFPDIMLYERYPEYSELVYALLMNLVEKNKINLGKHPDIIALLKDRVNEELKRRLAANQVDKASKIPFKDHYADIDYFSGIESDPDDEVESETLVSLMDMDYMDEEEVSYVETDQSDTDLALSELVMMLRILSYSGKERDWLQRSYDQVLSGKNRNDALMLTMYQLNTGKSIEDTVLKTFAKDPRIRIDFYQMLKKMELLQRFDTTYMYQQAFSESMIIRAEKLNEEDSLQFLQKRYIKTSRKNGYVYFYKHKAGYGKDKYWVISFVGIQPEDTLQLSTKSDILKTEVDRIYIQDDIDKVIDDQMKALRKLYRKRFDSYYNDYEDDEPYWEEEL